METKQALQIWHEIATARDVAKLELLIAEDAIFESPVVHTPQIGKEITIKYLSAALGVLGNDKFKYLNEWVRNDSAILEFESELDGIKINGIDMIFWNEVNQITKFKVMVRPLKAINMLHQKMGETLSKQ